MDQYDPNPIVSDLERPGSSDHGRFAFIQSSWHRSIVDQGRHGFLAEMDRQGVARDSIEIFEVPGAFEIPLLAKKLARTRRYKAVIACGFVVDGGIYRHEFVAAAVIEGLMSVQLDTNVPVLSVVLTPQRFDDSEADQQFFRDHFVIKGAEAASACLATTKTLRQLETTSAA